MIHNVDSIRSKMLILRALLLLVLSEKRTWPALHRHKCIHCILTYRTSRLLWIYPAWCTMLLKPVFRQWSRDFIRSGKLTSLPLPRSSSLLVIVKRGFLTYNKFPCWNSESKWMFNARKNECIYLSIYLLY